MRVDAVAFRTLTHTHQTLSFQLQNLRTALVGGWIVVDGQAGAIPPPPDATLNATYRTIWLSDAHIKIGEDRVAQPVKDMSSRMDLVSLNAVGVVANKEVSARVDDAVRQCDVLRVRQAYVLLPPMEIHDYTVQAQVPAAGDVSGNGVLNHKAEPVSCCTLQIRGMRSGADVAE